jgi:peptide deformylase
VPVCDILQLGNPLLWEKSSPVDNTGAPEIKPLINDLGDTLKAFRDANGFGLGIAAPQIGILKRVVYIRMESDGFYGGLINPEIVRESDERVELWDACFSLPNLMVRVSRAVEVEVEYTDEQGNQKHLKADGDLSELLQHEIDHLDGLLMIHRAISPRAFTTREEWARQGKSLKSE